LNQLSTLLCLPIWIVSFTLLYFDSRVRKEAYDLDLIAREINPGFYWQQPVPPLPPGYTTPPQTGWVRSPVLTSPLGLSGYAGPQARVENRPSEVGHTDAEEVPSEEFKTEPNVFGTPSTLNETGIPVEEPRVRSCAVCGAHLVPGASFCMNCGSLTNSD
jgi:zinc-ribbon domain